MSFTDALGALVEERAVWLGLALALAVTLLLTPLARAVALRLGLVGPLGDRPRVHRTPIPRIGGLAIAAGIMLPALLLVDLAGALEGIVLALPLVVLVGLVDDVRGLGAGKKLAAVTLLACVPVLGYDMTLDRISLPFLGSIAFGPLAIPLTLLWIALVTNLVNLIDGMDALAAGIVAIAAAAFALLAVSFGRVEVAALAAIVCGATVGFLRHNYHPATIFMGDSGALCLGFVLGSLAVEGALKNAATIALAAPLLIMAVPILDTSFVVAKRLKYKRRPWAPDQNHFYHRFLRIGFSQRRTAAYLHAWAAVLAAYAILIRFVPPRPGGVWDVSHTVVAAVAGLAVLAGSVWMVYELEILKARHFRRRAVALTPEPTEALVRADRRDRASTGVGA
ncbi:MAG: undecaprenyl/decaprenyl-phosphate alpha-N-acetylglucosaminyl 1-phosphate transferase [Actinomycetota bacterium]|nr:undecaprenyl/decaprenyl-phosphate alpha-N-acetylglucosaminyl 1-phosphate transferase [Actinomycetota bacterium]